MKRPKKQKRESDLIFFEFFISINIFFSSLLRKEERSVWDLLA